MIPIELNIQDASVSVSFAEKESDHLTQSFKDKLGLYE